MSPDEVDRTIALLEAIAADRARLAALEPDVRTRLVAAAGRVARPDHAEKRKLHKALRRRDTLSARVHDEALLAATEIRAGRADSREPARPAAAAPPVLLEVARSCYVCKADFRELHGFYDALCPPCAAENHAKRGQTADLSGRVALVTGARLKIGYHIALILLRAGARVLATTRFPHDAAARFAAEPDFEHFRDRLEVFGLDLRHAPSVELFATHLDQTLPRLDFLINNAAQTVRRPPAFYAHLLAAEEREPAPAARALLAAHGELRHRLGAAVDGAPVDGALVRWHGQAAVGLVASAQLSQVPCVADEVGGPLGAFPAGLLDLDAQQVDRRTHNSWRLPLAEVPTPELLEVHLVNAIAPFILCSRLRPALERAGTRDQHVVNVSAMEAQFARKKKTDKHPHTNMAKAALNMLTRTSAADYVQSGIHMNSVDTGWITDEDPLVHVGRKQRVHGFQPPLDVLDGAARVLDPIFTGLATGRHPWGKFFKDYREVAW
jgi:NAD(P)-dependent dehydrogenase (short-subunit alcohol dehydrogenase family)